MGEYRALLHLTLQQAEFLRRAMQDYLDVSVDVWVRRNARTILKKLNTPSTTVKR